MAKVLGQLVPLLKKVDLVHFHDLDLLPMMTALSLIKPVVYDVHENYPDEMLRKFWLPKVIRRPMYYVVKYSEIVLSRIIRNVILVAPSQERTFDRKKINSMYVKNYASVTLLDNVRSDYSIRNDAVVFIGSHHKENGSLLLLDIAAKLKKECPWMKIITADRFCNKDFRTRILDIIEQRRLSNIQFVPNVLPHNIMDILNQGTIAINPNMRIPQQINGIHTKIFEFMAAGLPIVTSDLPHQQMVLEDAGCGVLAQPEDPDSFVRAILYLCENKEVAYRLGLNGQRAFRERYCWESQIDGLLGFYQQVLQKESSGCRSEAIGYAK